MSASKTRKIAVTLTPSFIVWLGGAIHVAHQPGYGFWDGVIWLYYVGRYLAEHFTQLAS